MNAFEHAKSHKAPASLNACTKKQQKKGRTPRNGQWLPLECSCDEPAVKNGDCDLRTCDNSLLQKTVVILQRPAACHLRARLRGGDKALPPGPKNCVTGGPTLTTYEPSAIPSSIVFNKSIVFNHLEKPNSAACPVVSALSYLLRSSLGSRGSDAAFDEADGDNSSPTLCVLRCQTQG